MHAILTAKEAADVRDGLRERGIESAEVYLFEYGELGVEAARMIASLAHQHAHGAKYLVLGFDRATVAAQHALLKVVEDAPGGSHFYFCTPSPGALIATLRSRCVLEHAGRASSDETDDAARAFMGAAYADRITGLEKRLTQAERASDRTELRAFARALVRVHPCRETLTAARLLDESGASPKLILMHLALALPRAGAEISV